MPVCRYCRSRIDKFNKDRCPVCGELNPLEGVTSDTVEITTVIDPNGELKNEFSPKTKKVFFLLSCLIGWLGLQFHYLRYFKFGFIWMAINLVILGGGFSAFYFGLHNLLLGILLPLILVYACNISLGLAVLKKTSIKDANGNLFK